MESDAGLPELGRALWERCKVSRLLGEGCGLNQEPGKIGQGQRGWQVGQHTASPLHPSVKGLKHSEFKTASATHMGQPSSRRIWQSSDFKKLFFLTQ